MDGRRGIPMFDPNDTAIMIHAPSMRSQFGIGFCLALSALATLPATGNMHRHRWNVGRGAGQEL